MSSGLGSTAVTCATPLPPVSAHCHGARPIRSLPLTSRTTKHHDGCLASRSLSHVLTHETRRTCPSPVAILSLSLSLTRKQLGPRGDAPYIRSLAAMRVVTGEPNPAWPVGEPAAPTAPPVTLPKPACPSIVAVPAERLVAPVPAPPPVRTDARPLNKPPKPPPLPPLPLLAAPLPAAAPNTASPGKAKLPPTPLPPTLPRPAMTKSPSSSSL